jgi:hypothetical protein
MKIAICTPYYGDVTASYTNSLARMLLWTARATIHYNGVPTQPDIRLFMKTSSILPEARNHLVYNALEWGANYLLWVDSDHFFPEDALLRLLSLNLPVVGVNYPKRDSPTSPTALGLDDRLVWTTDDLARDGVVEQVKGLGLGFCLVDMNVIHTLSRETRDGEAIPFFAIEMLSGGLKSRGEDYFFFQRINAAGFAVHLDHQLSWGVGHVYCGALMNADAVAQKADYEQARLGQ